MTGCDVRANPPASRPARLQHQPPRLHQSDQIIPQPIRDRFIKDAFVAEPLVIQLQAFQFDTELVRAVPQHDRAKVRVASLRADAGELFRDVLDDVVMTRRGVFKTFKEGGISHASMIGSPGWSARPGGGKCRPGRT